MIVDTHAYSPVQIGRTPEGDPVQQCGALIDRSRCLSFEINL